MKRDPKDKVLELAARIGRPNALRLLVLEGVAPGTADKLLGDRYESEVGALLSAAIDRAIDASKVKVS